MLVAQNLAFKYGKQTKICATKTLQNTKPPQEIA